MIGVKVDPAAVFSVILTLVIVGALSLFGWHYNDLRKRAVSNDLRGTKIESTAGIIKDGAKSDKDRERVDGAVAQAAAKYEEELEHEKRKDPGVADRDARPVPDRLRELARERRLARERSVGAEQRSAKSLAEKDAPER